MRIVFPEKWSSVCILVDTLEQALQVEKVLNTEHPDIPKHNGKIFEVNVKNFTYHKDCCTGTNKVKFFIYKGSNGYGIVHGENHKEIPFNFISKRALMRKTIRRL